MSAPRGLVEGLADPRFSMRRARRDGERWPRPDGFDMKWLYTIPQVGKTGCATGTQCSVSDPTARVVMILGYGTWNGRSTLPSPTIRRADAALADGGAGARINLADRRTWHAGCRAAPTSGLFAALAP